MEVVDLIIEFKGKRIARREVLRRYKGYAARGWEDDYMVDVNVESSP